MKKVISIFILPQEIDELEQLLVRLKKSLAKVDPQNYIIDISLGVSSYTTDWDNSVLPKQYFIDKFNSIVKLLPNVVSRASEEIKGCVSQRRHTWKTYQDCDYFIWIDSDIVFGPDTLYVLEGAMEAIYPNHPLSVISPEIVKLWDSSWDCLVNENFLSKPYGYEQTNDPYVDAGVKGDISLEEIRNRGPIPMKIAGGLFSCISKQLLDKVTIPESLGHYGWEDTLIMHYCVRKKIGTQFKVKNLVACENYKYKDHSHITKYIKTIDRREELRQQATKAAMEYLNTL